MTKSERIALRVDADFKKKLEALAKSERRSVSSMIEIAVIEYIESKKPNRKGGS